MNFKELLLTLAPWLVFAVGAKALGSAWVGWVALVALAMVLVMLITRRQKGVSMLSIVGAVTFGIVTLVALIGDTATKVLVVDYGRGACTAILALAMLISVVTVPFTEQFARDVVPEKYWHSPRFRAVNRRISAIWAGIAVAHAACHFLSGRLASANPNHPESAAVNIVLNWVIPLGLTVVGVVVTKNLAARSSGRHVSAAAA